MSGGVDRVDDGPQRDARGERHLDDDPVDGRVVVERLDLESQDLARATHGQLVDPADRTDVLTRLQDLLEVDRRRRVAADEDHDERRCAPSLACVKAVISSRRRARICLAIGEPTSSFGPASTPTFVTRPRGLEDGRPRPQGGPRLRGPR